MFNNYNEFFNYKSKNPIKKYQKNELAYLLELKNFSGIYELNFDGKKFKYININNDDFGILKFFWGGEPEYISVKFWVDACIKDGICIDVGAHTGRYTVIGSVFSKKNNIVSFEPYYLNYSRMLSNLRLNNILTNNCFFSAASSKDGFSSFDINNNSKFFHTSAGKIIAEKQGAMRVPTIKLDSLTFKSIVNAIKIDTEGHEFEVLRGSAKLIDTQRPMLIIEKNRENFFSIINFLKEMDYSIYLIDDTNFKIQILNLNNKNYTDKNYKNILCLFNKNLKNYDSLLKKYMIE